MDTAQPKKSLKTFDEARAAFVRLVKQVGGNHGISRVFEDFLEAGAVAISNKWDAHHFEEREKRHERVMARYAEHERVVFSHMMAELVMGLSTLEKPDDFLGRAFMELELGNEWRGQFFTPMDVATLMAKMVIDKKTHELIKHQGFFTMGEPCIGGGAMALALARALSDEGLDYSRVMYLVGQDVDPRCIHMSYIQLGLLGVSGTLILGDSLRTEIRETWILPMHVAGGWNERLKTKCEDDADPGPDRIMMQVEVPAGSLEAVTEAPEHVPLDQALPRAERRRLQRAEAKLLETRARQQQRGDAFVRQIASGPAVTPEDAALADALRDLRR